MSRVASRRRFRKQHQGVQFLPPHGALGRILTGDVAHDLADHPGQPGLEALRLPLVISKRRSETRSSTV